MTYLERINHVINTICESLDGDLSLETLAGVAGFSPFHFHRIFRAVVGETLNEFVNRVRVERAAVLLRASPHMRVLDAAIACGYDSASGFSRAFKRHFGISPRQWDRTKPLKNRKIGQVFDSFPSYTIDKLRDAEISGTFTVRRYHLPRQQLAYVRVHDSYSDFKRIVEAYDCLLDWYTLQGGDLDSAKLYGMSMDDPNVTPLHLCRFDWCLAVPDDWQGEGDIHVRDFPACEVAAVHVQGDIHLEDHALQYLWGYWLPRSRFQPANLPAIEIYHQLPCDWQHFDMDCAIPITHL